MPMTQHYSYISLLLICLFFGCQKNVPTDLIDEKFHAFVLDSTHFETSNNRVHDFYKKLNYNSFWHNAQKRDSLYFHLSNAFNEGLPTKPLQLDSLDYYLKTYDSLDTFDKTKAEIMFTQKLDTYCYWLQHGFLDPTKLYHDWEITPKKDRTLDNIIEFTNHGSFSKLFESCRPSNPNYAQLLNSLKTLSDYPNLNDTTPIALNKNNKLKLGDQNATLIHIKKKLHYWKDYKSNDTLLTNIFDEHLQKAVLSFQKRHQMNTDGIIGAEFVKNLNITKESRLKQIICNLERWRWYPENLGDHYSLVNIAASNIVHIKKQDTIFNERVIVGLEKRRTPVLSSTFDRLVFNPTWTLPPTIVKEDVSRGASHNLDYFKNKKITISKNGQEITPEQWDVNYVSSYKYVQSPGKHNSMGLVKFMFPNDHAVYLHDTNAKSHFNNEKRTLSSGCVRVRNPFKYAAILLKKNEGWTMDQIDLTIQKEATKTVYLKDKIDVHLLYWTAWSHNNQLFFAPDIYNFDKDLYQKLEL